MLRLAEESGYRPNPAAVNLRAGRSDTVGVIVPEMVTPFAATVIGGIQRVLYDRGLKVVIVQSDESPAVEREHLLLMERFMVEGIIACPCDATRNGEVYRRLRQRGVPLVFYDRAPGSASRPRRWSSTTSPRAIFSRNIWCDGDAGGSSTSAARRTFPMRGSACAGIAMPWRSSGLRRTEGRSSRRGSPSATAVRRPTSCCAACPEADGIFAWTDTVAVGAMNRLMACGVRIPGRMAVAGYSGTVLSTIVNPQLTTVEQPLDRDGAPRPPNCCWSGSPMRRRPIALSC